MRNHFPNITKAEAVNSKINIVRLQIPHTSVEGVLLTKISKRVAVLSVVVAVIVILVLANFHIFYPDAFTLPQIGSKMQVSNLKIEPSSNWQSSNIRLSVTNTYNSPITVIGSKVNGINFGYIEIEVPPGQTQNAALPLSNLLITNSTVYNTDLTFTFDDGQYEVYSDVIVPIKYVGAFAINGQSMNGTSNSTIYSVTIQNTGNIPLVSTKCTIENYVTSLPLKGNLMPKNTITLDCEIPLTFDKGTSALVTLEATFAEGSTVSSKTAYSFFQT